MCAVDRIQTAGDKPFMEAIGVGHLPPIGPIQQTNYPNRNRLVVRLGEGGIRELLPMEWGLLPFYAKERKPKVKPFNARADTLAKPKSMFRPALKSRRCLLPATSYIEYRDEAGKKAPYEFLVDGGRPYVYAGLWESWGPREEPVLTCTMITAEPNALAADYHNRMPAILLPEDYEAWLDPNAREEDLLRLLAPLPDERLTVRPTVLIREARTRATATESLSSA